MPATRLDPQIVMGDVTHGVITGVSPRIAPRNSVEHAVNLVFDETLGEAEVRAGSARVGDAAVNGSSDIDGLFHFVDSEGGSNSKVLASAGGTIFQLQGDNTWATSLTSDTAGVKKRFATFLDSVVRVNGTDDPKSFDGSAWATSGGAFDLANMPNGKFVIVFKDQVIVAGVSGAPDTLQISSIPTSGAISWTSGNRSITVDPDSNGNITGIGKIAGLLIVFKDDAMYRWNNRATEPDALIDVGCSSHESIAVGGNLMFFFNEQGVWATQGGYPLFISSRIQKWVDAVSASNRDDVTGHCDGKHYWCSVGDVTLKGVTYSNVVFKYSLQMKSWAVLSYATRPLFFAKYRSSGSDLVIYGDASSNVVQIDTGTTDFDGSSIAYEIETHRLDFGSRARVKEIKEHLIGYGEELTDAHLSILEGDAQHPTPIGAMNGDVSYMEVKRDIRSKYFKFKVSGTAATAQRFSGIEIPNISIHEYAR